MSEAAPAIPPEIMTSTGHYFNFLEPENSRITIEGIAHSLSLVCRWGGQCNDFYSVAQHSVLVSMVVHPALRKRGMLHDAEEFVTGDMTKPLKQLCPDFERIADGISRTIHQQFNLPFGKSAEIKLADRIVEATERRDLMDHQQDAAHSTLVAGLTPLAFTIRPWPPRYARRMYLLWWKFLTVGWEPLDNITDTTFLTIMQRAVSIDHPLCERP